MRLGCIGQIHNDRVVQHRAIPFRHRIEFLHQVGDELKMKLVNFDLELAGVHSVEAAAVADTVFIQVNSQARKPYAEVGISHAGSDGDGPGQAANQGGRSDVELGIEAIGLDLRFELVGDLGSGSSQGAFDLAETTLAVTHVFVTLEMGLELIVFGTGDLALQALDVLAQEIEQVGPGVELGLGIAPGDAAKERAVRCHGLADGRRGLALAPSRRVVDDVIILAAGDADAKVRKNAAELLAERDVDGLIGRRSTAADATAAVISSQGTKVIRVPAAGNPA